MTWLVALAVLAGATATGGSSLRHTAYGRGVKGKSASRFWLPGAPESQWTAVHEFRLRTSTGKATIQSRSRIEVANDGRARASLSLDEAYGEGTVGPFDLTLGKKVLSWGVGNAFRPLDVVQRENRRRWEPTDLQGVPLVALEHFGAAWALSAVYFNRVRLDTKGVAAGAHEAAFKSYAWVEPFDIHAVAHASSKGTRTLGVGAAAVFGDGWEVHAAAAYRNLCDRPINTLTADGAPDLADGSPFIPERVAPCPQAVAGLGWTAASGITVMLEAWHDRSGYSQSQWDDLVDLIDRQRALLGETGVPPGVVEQNLAAELRFFDQTNLRQNSLLVRLAYVHNELEAALDAVVTPDDGGLVATGSVRYEVESWLEMFGAARAFTGRARSAYRELPRSYEFYAGVRSTYAP